MSFVPCVRSASLAGGFLIVAALLAGSAVRAEPPGVIKRELWSFDRSELTWGEGVSIAREKATGKIVGGKGWVEYDVQIPMSGWYELWLTGMPSGWARDVSIDGKAVLRQSIAMAEDRDDSGGSAPRFKEANLYFEAGKHALRIGRLDYPTQFPTAWDLVPAGSRPEASIRIVDLNDAVQAPGGEFKLQVAGGDGTEALSYDLFLKSLADDGQPVPVGNVSFPKTASPVERSMTIKPAQPGAYVVLAQHDGKWLRPNDIKSGPLIVSASVPATGSRVVPAALSVAGMFAEGMVVQRQVPLPVWGWAPPGNEVSVQFAGQSRTARADAEGRWRVTFQPLEAGGPHRLEIASGDQSVKVGDVLVGDVWLLGGQSNMGGQLGSVPNGPAEVEKANYPKVRFTVAMTHTPLATDPRPLTCAWQVAARKNADAEAMNRWNAIAYAFGTDLHRRLDIPIGMIMNSRGGTAMTTWVSRSAQKAEPGFRFSLERAGGDGAPGYAHRRLAVAVANSIRTAREKQAKDATPIVIDSLVNARVADQARGEPQGHFDALVEPLSPFPFKGAIWYQGEADMGQADVYGAMLRTFLADWRKTLENPSLPFIVVQIAQSSGSPFDGPPTVSRYGQMQEAQASILSQPGTSIISTYDLPGPKDDVHYKDKLPVGHRAAMAALHDVYGLKDVVGTGPRYRTMKVEGGKVRLTFNGLGGGLVKKGDRLGGFAIAGEDRLFVWADAEIDGEEVVVSSEKVARPVAVRYGWANRPCGANLYNAAGLPATVFRTDDWVVDEK